MADHSARTPPAPERLHYLDGLRGVAALVVVVFHFLCAYLPDAIPDETPVPWRISDTPVQLLYNGTFAVVVFFVLSGFVVSNSAAKKRDHLLLNLGLRYARLALPAAASVLFAWALLSLLPNETTRLAQVIPHVWLGFTYQGADIPGPLAAAIHGLFGVFRSGNSGFNNVLWTMKIELIGSCALYVLYRFFAGRWRLAVLLACAVALPAANRPLYEGFVLGALLRDAWAAGRLPSVAPLPLFVLGALLGSVSTGFYARTGLPHLPYMVTPGEPRAMLYPLGAALMVYGCIKSPALRALFAAAPARFLGRISFSLYLYHVPFLYTVFAAAYLALAPASPGALVLLLAAFLCVSLVAGTLATIAIDEPVLRLNAALRAAVRRRMPVSPAPA